MNAFDVSVFHFINHFAGHIPVVDFVMAFFARYALELYAILFLIAWLKLPKADTEHRHALVVAACAGVVALIVNFIISHIWFRPRPFMALPAGTYTQLIPHGPDASFPSDHASGSFAFAAASWGKNEKWIRRSITWLAVIVMVARVYVGVHWPTDVIAGFVVGTLSGRIVWKFSRHLYPLTAIGLKIFGYGPTKRRKHEGVSKSRGM